MTIGKPLVVLVVGAWGLLAGGDAAAQDAPPAAPPAPPAATAAPPASKAASGLGTVRVRATCGTDPRPMGDAHALAVDDVTNERARMLKPTSDPSPRMKLDEATHREVLTDPEFVDYQLPAGSHRLRVAASRCQPDEQAVEVVAGEVLEFAPHLEATASPVHFRRPGDAPATDHIALMDRDGRVLCADLPCNWDVPIRSGYSVVWARPLGTMTAEVPQSLDTLGLPAGKTTKIDERLEHKPSVWALPLIAAGGASAIAGLILYLSKLGQTCTQTFYGAGGHDVVDDFRCGEHNTGYGEAALSETQSLGAVGYTSIGMMIGGGVLAAGGLVLELTGALGHDALSLQVETSKAAPTRAPAFRAAVTPWGVGGSF